ncbi:hypothetical protein QNM99_24050 [Pseudomonas sp. PCH446]
MVGRPYIEDNPLPDPTNCQIDCRNAVVLEKARRAIEENITFYTSVLLGNTGNISRKAELDLRRKIAALELHLENLVNNQHKAVQLIEAREIA